MPGEELRRRDRPLAVRPACDEVRIEREQDGGKVGCRVAVGDGAADGAAVTDLGVADLCGGIRKQRAVLDEHRATCELGVSRERADRDRVAVRAHVAQVVEPSDVDEERRAGEAQAHERDQRVAAGEELRVLVSAEQLDGLLDGAGAPVLEGGGDHAPASAAACTALTMLW